MTPVRQHSEKLESLQHMLYHLPDSVPFHGTTSTQYDFSVGEDDIVDFGDINSATNRALEISFGNRSETNGIVPIKEKGPGIIAVVDMLCGCLAEDPSDARLTLWRTCWFLSRL